MIRRARVARRRGAVAVESAIVYPVMLLILFGIIVGGMGVFRYQMTACLARETSRYASVRGADWQRDNLKASPTEAEMVRDVVTPMAVSMDAKRLTVRVEWVDGVTGQVMSWDASNKATTTVNADGEPVANRVRTTVTYRWTPELFLRSTDLRSSSETPMSY
jgi:Flp pilus assembly protein TadG